MKKLSTSCPSASLHDARVERIVLLPGGKVELVFAHLDVYIPKEGPKFEVRSHRAKISASRVDGMTIDGEMNDEGWVVDGAVPGDGGDEGLVELTTFPRNHLFEPGEVHLVFNNGCAFRLASKGKLAFQLLDEGEFLEYFTEDGGNPVRRSQDGE